MNPIAAWLDSCVDLAPDWRRRKALRESPLRFDAFRAMEEKPSQERSAWRKHVDRLFNHPYFSFEPRPDDYEAGDEQTGYVESKAETTVALGGNGCLGGEQRIFDPVIGEWRRIDQINGRFHIYTRNPSTGAIEVTQASNPWIKGVDRLYRWTLSTGAVVIATAEHRVVTTDGCWTTLAAAFCERLPLIHQEAEPAIRYHGKSDERYLLRNRDAVLRPRLSRAPLPALREIPQAAAWGIGGAEVACTSPYIQLSTILGGGPSVRRASGRRSCRRPQVDLGRYRPSRLCGELPPSAANSGQAFSPSPSDAREHSRDGLDRDGLASLGARILDGLQCGRPSKIHCAPSGRRGRAFETPHASQPCLRSSDAGDTLGQCACANTPATPPTPVSRQSLGATFDPARTTSAFDRQATEAFLSSHPKRFEGIGGNGSAFIVACEYLRTSVYYDISTPPHANYILEGLTHANSGKSLLAGIRVVDFIANNPPPEKDVPFWVIANTMEQVCRTCWHEKLRLLLPTEWVDWKRIDWYRRNREWPLSVPLMPRANGNNFVLEFHSYEKGREAMQAAAIAGAWFTEAFPWDVFEEVSARCRQYEIPSSIWCEFTPLNPEKSAPIQERYETKLADPEHPTVKDWAFFRLSTIRAKESGHITERGFNRIVSSVSEEMRETRLRGAFASYQGAIYQTYNPQIHCRTINQEDIPKAVIFKRAIDWGASEEHAFVCLWAFKDSLGAWYVFQEYFSTDQTKTALDHIDTIHDMWDWPENNPWYRDTYADPSRPDLIRLFSAAGIPITGAYNNVYDGIEAVRKHLKKHEGIDEPMLFIDRDRCPKLARQMSTYRWEQSSGMGVNPKAARPVPLKRDDDAVDALRYLIATDTIQGQGGASAGKAEAPRRPHVRHRRK